MTDHSSTLSDSELLLDHIKKYLTQDDKYCFLSKQSNSSENTDQPHLIASLTKPVVSYYFQHQLFESYGIDTECNISNFFATHLDLTIGDLLSHKGNLFDYLELERDTINSFDLNSVCKEVLSRTSPQSNRVYEYSNSSYVLLSKIIEIITGDSYQNEIRAFYLDRGIDFSFSDKFSNYISGWGDGAIISDVKNYLRFMDLKNAHLSFDALLSKYHCKFYSGTVPGWYSLAVFFEDIRFVLFTNRSDGESVTDKILDEFESFKK